MSRFMVIHLQEDRLDQALPLARMAAPLLTPEHWREFVRLLAKDDGGILAAIAGDGRTHGVAAYRIQQGLTYGRALRVEPMVTFEISRSAPARTALCDALELLALAKACDSLVIATSSRGYASPVSAKAAAWAPLGFDLASVELVKRLAGSAAESTAILSS